MGENPIAAQVREGAHAGNLLHRLRHILVGLKADASHAGIHLDMTGHRDPCPLCLLLELSGIFQRKYRLGDVVLAQLTGLVGRCGPQNQDGVINPLIPQRHRLGQIGDSKPVDPQTHQLIRNIFIPMPVGIRFDHSHNHTARLELFLDCADIVVDAVQVHHSPAAPEKINHPSLLLILL